MEGWESGGGLDFAEPADAEGVVAGDGVDRDDGALGGGCDPGEGGVDVGGGQVASATLDHTGAVADGRGNTLADGGGLADGGKGIGFEVAGAVGRLGVEAHIPDGGA